MVEGQWQYQRAMLRGILEFASEHTHWDLRHTEPENYLRGELADWPWDGMLLQVDRQPARRVARQLRGDSRPIISLADTRRLANWPCVVVSNDQIGRMAAEYLLAKQARTYAFFGDDRSFCLARCIGYRAVLAGQGVPVQSLKLPAKRLHASDAGFIRLLQSWSKPVAVFAGNDYLAFWLASLCATRGVAVPDEVMILGVDNDELLCNFSHPRLSSIAVPAEESGYRGAEMLAALLRRRSAKAALLQLPPRYVVPRESTEIYLTSDSVVRQAQRFISDRMVERVNVSQAADKLNVSRRQLERRFYEALGHGPHAELMRLRMIRAQSLLRATEKSMAEVARQCGFRDASHFSLAFRREMGLTPSDYRRGLSALPDGSLKPSAGS